MRPGARARALVRPVVALALAVATCAWVLAAQGDVGLARDEIVYMHHGSRYADWWLGLARGEDRMTTADTITRHFGGPGATDGNREHPPLMKTLFGLSERLLHRELGWLDRVSAYRLPTAAMHGLLIALVYLFAAGIWGQAIGLLAALFTLLLPRAFFHAGLATFDGPVVTMWLAVLIAYWRALGSRAWCLVLGLVYGLALATKHNALLLPAALVPHYLWVSFVHGRGIVASRAASRSVTRAVSPAVPGDAAAPGGFARATWARSWVSCIWHGAVATRPLLWAAMLVLGPLVLIALWPWLWLDPVEHVAAWVRFHVTHVHYNYEYLGENWNAPPFPWHVPVVTTLLTAPVVTLLAALLGGVVLLAARRWRWATAAAPLLCGASSEDRGPGHPDGSPRAPAMASTAAPMLLLVLSAAVAVGPFVLGRVPIFGAEKHWAAAMPTLCILAAIGVTAAGRLAVNSLAHAGLIPEAREHAARVALIAALAGAALGAALVETVRAQPYALSHYNALAGGAPGGADLGMNRQFWGISARGVLPYLNQLAPDQGARARPVYSHDASPAWSRYRSEGLLAPGLPDAGHERHGVTRSRIALIIHERHFRRHVYMVWDAYGTVQPAYVLRFQGVPLVSVYVRE